MGIETAAIIAAVAAAASTGYQVHAGMEAKSEQRSALARQQDAQKAALAETKSAQEKAQANINRANQRRPDVSSILSSAEQSGQGGVSSTMLTGPQGIDPASLTIGKNTLLGG